MDNVIFVDASPSKRKAQGSHSILSSPLPPWMDPKKFCLDSIGYMELFMKQIWEVLPLSRIDDWAAVLSDKLEGEKVKSHENLLISLVGFDCSKKEKKTRRFTSLWPNGW